MQAHRRATGFYIGTIFFKIVTVVFEKNWSSANIFQSVSKQKHKKKTNPIQFHNYRFFFKQDLTLAKNKATTYAFKIIMIKQAFKYE